MTTDDVPWTTAPEHVRRMVPRLDINHDTWQTAYRLAREYDGDVDATPKSVAAGAVYAAGLLHNDKRTQAVVAEAAECSVPAIRRAYPQLLQADGYDLPAKREREPDPEPRWSVTVPWPSVPGLGSLPALTAVSVIVVVTVTVLLLPPDADSSQAFVEASREVAVAPTTGQLLASTGAMAGVVVVLSLIMSVWQFRRGVRP